MKRYKINKGYRVNTETSKTGTKWRYRGTTDNPEETIAEYKRDCKHGNDWLTGLRITDTTTNETVYEDLR